MAETSVVPRGYDAAATLGDGQVWIRRHGDGGIKAVKGVVKLEEQRGELTVIQGKATPSAAGYFKLNQIAGCSIVTPETLTMPDGSVRPNPYPIMDEASGTLRAVYVRKVAFGYTPTGNPVVTSATLWFDIFMYLVQDLVKSFKSDPSVGHYCMRGQLTEQELRTGMFCPINGDFGFWADYRNKEVLKAIETMVQNKLFAERKASTVAERNALKKQPALACAVLPAQGPDRQKVAQVPVVGWTHDLTQAELQEVFRQAERGERVTVRGHEAQVFHTEAEITAEEMAEAGAPDEDVAAAEADGPDGGVLL